MKGAQPSPATIVAWIIIGWGIVSVLLTLFAFYRSPRDYAWSFYFIFFGLSFLFRPTRRRLANVCLVLAFGALLVVTVLRITG